MGLLWFNHLAKVSSQHLLGAKQIQKWHYLHPDVPTAVVSTMLQAIALTEYSPQNAQIVAVPNMPAAIAHTEYFLRNAQTVAALNIPAMIALTEYSPQNAQTVAAPNMPAAIAHTAYFQTNVPTVGVRTIEHQTVHTVCLAAALPIEMKLSLICQHQAKAVKTFLLNYLEK